MRHATNESQKTPEDSTEAAKAFRSTVNALWIRHEYTFFNISNMHQTMVTMDSPANRMNNVVGESTVRIWLPLEELHGCIGSMRKWTQAPSFCNS
ncbi:hypothetical protein HPB49_010453 [Dermacentor silvarum]|uniref:Uncharacterized protein n=1 Tax=Dermacentor silvarum TaxID=543639 RepID=A0ACB8CKP3_DERSI|nr:hypothetical protein HPB49_010453 [Dermacentor silvarum]